MCKSHNPRVIDKCMRKAVEMLNILCLKRERFTVVACCCGHGRYPMTIMMEERTVLIEHNKYPHQGIRHFELFSGKRIPRKKRFYLKDKKGYYYIPEVLKAIWEEKNEKLVDMVRRGKDKALVDTWDFVKFKISCGGCQSSNVEINGKGEAEEGYYGAAYHEGSILVKCGAAMRINLGSDWKLKGRT